MAELTVNMTYGSALYEVAKDLNKQDEIYEELVQILEIFKNQPSFFEFIATPVIAKGEKKEALKAIFDGKLIPELLNFLYVLVDKNRGTNFAGITEYYKTIMDKDRKIAEGIIYSAIPLTAGQVSEFEESVAKLIKENARLVNKVDETLIGGVKVLIEGKVIDASIKTKLRSIKENLNAAVV